MRRRKLITALVATGAFSAGAAPAHAELRQLRVTLVDGRQLTVTVDVPADTPVDQLAFSGLPAEVDTVEDLGPAATPVPTPTVSATPARVLTPEPTASPVPAPTATATPVPTATPTATATPFPAATPTATATATPFATATPTATPSVTVTPTPTPGRETERPARGNLRGNAQVLSGELSTRPTPGPTPAPQSTPAPGTAPASPTTGVAQAGIPNFFIEQFRIPPFLLPIYQAAAIQYGVRWEVLAAINEIETDYGRNLSISSAGALGWMQFIPSSWARYGVDGNHDGLRDPYNPVDAIFAAARYLRAAGAGTDLGRAIFAYNHADWYVESVLLRARFISGLPADLVSSLTGLTQGRFPVAGRTTYSGRLTRSALSARRGVTPARPVASDGRRAVTLVTRVQAPVVAVNDGRVVRIGRTSRLGRFVALQDAYGNTYTYARLGAVAKRYPAVHRRPARAKASLPDDSAPSRAASRTTRSESAARRDRAGAAARPRRPAPRRVRPSRTLKKRLFAHPDRPHAAAAGGLSQIGAGEAGLGEQTGATRRLKRGARVTAGTVLGRAGRVPGARRGRVRFTIRPAGRGAPRIDPKPVLDGWRLLESTAVYRAGGRSPFLGADAATPSIGQVLLLGKDALARRVLANPRIEVYGCGRLDIRAGLIDRRVLATLEFLAASGLNPTVSSLECGHSYYTASGNVSHHSSGNAVDIAAINGIPIAGHQGPGSITETTIQRLLTLQASMKPDQIISLMTFAGTDNTFAMGDHADHIHVGYRPQFGANRRTSAQVGAILQPSQWRKLIARLGQIDNPRVREQPSRFAVKATKPDSGAARGE